MSPSRTLLVWSYGYGRGLNPITSMTCNAISNSSRQVSQRTDVRIDNIEIQTQATDAKGIAQEIPGSLKDATWHFDDGPKA
ncbi:hypothetical protein HH682_04020 [Rosenbergiella sp. S61]|uniref:Uncharacterized protein n=1 Tax=Rosenbergiella gaditana TaxID=2726987 RepID=A0ABS5SU38_9GAMM|nr:hypothetical protein [Rosenbergiella gaditana]MBT0723623.1 hypothetical protein [Rosenbergiella gaditana]